MSILLEQFERAVKASPGTPRASMTRRAGVLYGVAYGVIMTDKETDGKADIADMQVVRWRDDIEEYRVPPSLDLRPGVLLTKDSVSLDGLLDEVADPKKLAFAMGKWGAKAQMSLHIMKETGATSFEEVAATPLELDAFMATIAEIWRIPTWMTLSMDDIKSLHPRLRVQSMGAAPPLVLELEDDGHVLYIILPRQQRKADRCEVMAGGKRYVNDVWDDKLIKFKKWKEGKMELPKPVTKSAPVVQAPVQEAKLVEEPKPEVAASAPQPEVQQPVTKVEAPAEAAKPAEEKPKKKPRPQAPKAINYEELIAAISQVPESLTAQEAKAALRSLRDLEIAIARAMANISTQTLDAYEADANRYQELKKLIK